MIEQYNNPYERLNTYYNMFHTEDVQDFGISILQLHQMLSLPLSLIRADLVMLCNSTIFPVIPLEESEEYEAAADKSGFDDEDWYKHPLPENCKNHIMSGDMDLVPFYAEFSDSYDYTFSLSADEMSGLNHFLKKDKQSGANMIRFHVKNMYNKPSEQIAEYISIIRNAMANKKPIEITYKSPRGKISTFPIHPLKIVYDNVEGIFAILSVYQDAVCIYRIDRIKNIKQYKQPLEMPSSDKLDIYPHVWGLSFSEEPIKVKVRFYNEANVWAKVRRDLSCRTEGKLYEEDGFLYYEDIVYGIKSFRKWIYSYGSSAIVIEPQQLREEIIESYRERLSYYN